MVPERGCVFKWISGLFSKSSNLSHGGGFKGKIGIFRNNDSLLSHTSYFFFTFSWAWKLLAHRNMYRKWPLYWAKWASYSDYITRAFYSILMTFHYSSRGGKNLTSVPLIRQPPTKSHSPGPADIKSCTHFNGMHRCPGFICQSGLRQSVMCGLPMKFMADSDINCNRTDGPRFSGV